MIEKLEETAVAVMHAIETKDCARVTSIEFGPCGSDLELPPSADEAGSCVALSVQDAHGHASKPKPISREAGDISPRELHLPQKDAIRNVGGFGSCRHHPTFRMVQRL